MLNGCKTGKGYVLGSRFVGGLAGGFTGSGVQQNDTNSSDVFGNRYVGGIVSVNGSNSQISGMTNTGLVAAFGQNAAYVGGIVGVNDADWGGSQDPKATATVQNCANRMSGDNATDTRRINLLKELNGYADYVGGIAGCNGKNGVVTWDKSGTPTLGAILYGNNYVGGVAGYNDENATISNTSTQNLTISGQIVAAGKAVGGMIGLNCASTLPSATVKVSRVAGQQLVGGVIGANLPVGNFTMADGGAFITDVASGRVEADAVAGGIIGYNRLLAAKPTNVTLAALLPTIDQNTGVLTDSTDANTSDGTITLTDFQNKLNLQADIYVGGIVGANDAKTKLTIQNATNGATQNALSVGGLNPSNNGAFKGGVSLNALADGRYDFDDVHGALAGGIIGYATPNTTLENCTNYGTVAHKCAAGGFAGTRARSPAAACRRPSATVKPGIPIWAALRASTAVLFTLPTRLKTAPCAATAMSAALRASTWAVTLRQARASSSARGTTAALARWRPTSTRAAWPVPTSAISRCPASCKAVSPPPAMRAAWPVSIRIRAAFAALKTPTARSVAASLPPTTRAAWPVRTVPKSPVWRTTPRCAPAQNMRAVLRA